MQRHIATRIVLIWLAWAVILIGYMQIASARLAPNRPDDALTWSATETTFRSNNDKPYLLEPFLNTQVAWDSEFYLGIATAGYDNPDIRLVESGGEAYSMSYAFFPLYPFIMQVVRAPFELFGMGSIAASTLAGVLVSLLGTLAAMFALYDIVRDELGEAGGLRTVFLMLVFPTSVFFVAVYTEGLFVGLAFGSLALMRRQQFVAAGLLAAAATWTRAIGGVLVAPLLLTWGMAYYRQIEDRRALLWRLPALVAPVVAYGLWRLAYGQQFDFVEEHWFGNQLLDLETTRDAWRQILERARAVPETAIVVALGVSGIALALISCVVCLWRYPALALFGLIALVVPLTGGWTGTQSAVRYILAVPTLWILLGRLSRDVVFDRAWTLLSVLLLAMQAFLFSYDFWVA
ncbi:MAG: mannosyltransferase family protein [Phototrophicaceae bacterium]